ncbi:MAG: RNA polymerase sigma factor [Phycisphaeraceae bacterium]
MTQPSTDSQRDDARAERFYAEIWPEAAMLMRTAISLTPATGQNAEAEDLVQETLLKAFKAIDRLEPGTHPRAWLLTMLRRTWIDRWRKKERRPDGQAVDLDAVAEPEGDVSSPGEHDGDWSEPDALLSRFGDQQIIDALRLLPEGYRWALLLVDVQSLTIEEAAQTLDVALGTVKSRLHRGRAMLRDRLHGFATERGWLTDKQGHAIAEGKNHD